MKQTEVLLTRDITRGSSGDGTAPDVRTVPRPACSACGAGGAPRFRGLTDRLYGAPGQWTLSECRGPGCGLLWLDPMPAVEDLGKLYEGYFTHADPPRLESPARSFYRRVVQGYLRRRYGYLPDGPAMERLLGLLLYLHPGRRAAADALVMHLPFRTGGRLLEIGCGSGQTLERLQDLGWEGEGVDFDGGAVENARNKGLRVHQGSVGEQGYPGASFDAVIGNNVIEHVPDPAALIGECHRILRPGGELVLLTPNASSVGCARYGEDWRGLEPPRHLQIFTPASLVRIARSAGFTGARCDPTPRAGSMLLASRRLRAHGRIPSTEPSILETEAAHLVEWAICLLWPERCEEMVLRATRTAP